MAVCDMLSQLPQPLVAVCVGVTVAGSGMLGWWLRFRGMHWWTEADSGRRLLAACGYILRPAAEMKKKEFFKIY